MFTKRLFFVTEDTAGLKNTFTETSCALIEEVLAAGRAGRQTFMDSYSADQAHCQSWGFLLVVALFQKVLVPTGIFKKKTTDDVLNLQHSNVPQTIFAVNLQWMAAEYLLVKSLDKWIFVTNKVCLFSSGQSPKCAFTRSCRLEPAAETSACWVRDLLPETSSDCEHQRKQAAITKAKTWLDSDCDPELYHSGHITSDDENSHSSTWRLEDESSSSSI